MAVWNAGCALAVCPARVCCVLVLLCPRATSRRRRVRVCAAVNNAVNMCGARAHVCLGIGMCGPMSARGFEVCPRLFT